MGEAARVMTRGEKESLMKPYRKEIIPLAKELRKNMTPAERQLWYGYLRTYPVRFQRQKTIGTYIADFYCAKAKLVVELDGGQHGAKGQTEEDLARTMALEEMGLKVIRFWNSDVFVSFPAVAGEIDRVVKQRCGGDYPSAASRQLP